MSWITRTISRILHAFVCMLTVMLCAPPALADEPVPAEAFAQLREMSGLRISPGGDYLAWMGRSNGLPALFTFDISAGTIIHKWESTDEVLGNRDHLLNDMGDGFDEYLVRGFRWLNDNRLAVTIDFPRPRVYYGQTFHWPEVRLLAVNVDGTDGLMLFHRRNEQRAAQFSDPYLARVDDNSILALFSQSGPKDVRRINHYTGENTVVEEHDDLSYSWRSCGWRANSSGEVLIRRECGPDLEFRYTWRERNGGRWQPLREVNRIAEDVNHFDFSPRSLTSDGRTLYVHSRHEGREGLYRISFDAPETLERVYLHDRYDVQSSFYDRVSGELLGVSYVDEFPRTIFFDATLEQLVLEIGEALPGEVTQFVNRTDDGQVLVFATYGDQEPAVYSMVDLSDGSFSIISPSRPDLPAERMGVRTRIRYTARDGVEIEGILNYPEGAGPEDGPFPLVVLPHGGPYVPKDDASFDGLAQFIATRGYLVFQPNYRGTGGYGNEFIATGYRQWGQEMQTDITDGVNFLTDDMGLADPSRMCTVGWSYGAYAALQGVLEEPGMFKCAIGINGVYDLISVLMEDRGFADYWNNALGHPASDQRRLLETSPRRNADAIEVPVLIIYSREDYTVPYEQGERMFEALEASPAARRGDVVHRVVDIATGDHSMNPEPDRIQTYQAVEDFLAEHL